MNMWSYWRDKKGVQIALEDQYPEVLAADPDLQMAMYQIKAAEALIDLKMSEREEDE